jgi:hypothetical protein
MIKDLYVPVRRTAEQRLSGLRALHWRHFYRDRRFVILASLVLAVVATYALTGDFTWHPRHGMVPVSNAAAK